MGLDQYLRKHIYLGANFEHNKVEGKIEITVAGKPVKINLKKIVTIVEDAGYWRKANQIHKWFVDNVQKGNDDCREYHVSVEQLKALHDLCVKAVETNDATLLPPMQGFFFGQYEINEWYWADIKATIELLKPIIESPDDTGEYYYDSSW